MRLLSLCLLSLLAVPAFAAEAPRIARESFEVTRISRFDPSHPFDDPAWRTAPAFPMLCFMIRPEDLRRLPQEKGSVCLLYDEDFLYVRADLADSEIRNDGEDNTHLYNTGDVLEVFLKPLNFPDYWEIYGSANGKHTAFHYPSRGCLGLPLYSGPQEIGVKVFTAIEGSLNHPGDADRSWSVIVAIPRKELDKEHGSAGNPLRWTIAVTRYNHGKTPGAVEFSTAPQVADHFHASEYYALLDFMEEIRR